MTSPIPALKPTSTGSEMKFATKPSRRIAATTSTAPTSNVNVAHAAVSDAVSPPGATSPRAAAARIDSVVVVVTLSGRDVPSTA